MFVAKVARQSENMATERTILSSNLLSSLTGSQIASPKITIVADVTATPMNAYRPIVAGKPIVWPSTWSCCERAYREKSGILSDSVAQNPTFAVSAGKKNAQNPPAFGPPGSNWDG